MKKDVKQSLNQAIDRLPHPTFEEIADTPVEKMEKMDAITRQTPAERKRRLGSVYRLAVPACLSLMLAAGLGNQYVRQNLMVDSVIDIDVNPSFEITSNKKDRVLQVEGLNAEAADLLKGRNYKGWEVNEAVEALLITLDDGRYLDAERNTILLSVSSKDTRKAERMRNELDQWISQVLSDAGIRPVVVRQERSEDEQLAQKAVQYQISPGKMQLVEALTRQEPSLQEETLAQAPVEELYRILRQQEKAVPDWLEVDEEDWYDDDRDEEDHDDDDRDGEDHDEPDGGGKDKPDKKDRDKANKAGGGRTAQGDRNELDDDEHGKKDLDRDDSDKDDADEDDLDKDDADEDDLDKDDEDEDDLDKDDTDDDDADKGDSDKDDTDDDDSDNDDSDQDDRDDDD